MLKLNHTQISNDFLDNYMNKVSGNAVKVFLAISRKTIGWHKDIDRISQSQLILMTGLSVNTIKSAITELIENGLIIVIRNGIGKGIKTYFEINYSDNVSNIDDSKKTNVSNYDIKNDVNPSNIDIKYQSNVSNFDTTKEININKDINKLGESNDTALYKELQDFFLAHSKSIYDFKVDSHQVKTLIALSKKIMPDEYADFAMKISKFFLWLITKSNDPFFKKFIFLPRYLVSQKMWALVVGRFNQSFGDYKQELEIKQIQERSKQVLAGVL